MEKKTFDNGFLLFGPFQFERAWPYIWTNFTLFKQEMLFEIGWPVILEEEIVRFRWCIIAILLSSLLWKGWGPLFKQTWIPFTKECFVPNLGWNCPSGSAKEDLKKNLSMSFWYFIIYMYVSLAHHLNKFKSPHPRIICAKFDWNWPSGSGEKNWKYAAGKMDRRTDDRQQAMRKAHWSFQLWLAKNDEIRIHHWFSLCCTDKCLYKLQAV